MADGWEEMFRKLDQDAALLAGRLERDMIARGLTDYPAPPFEAADPEAEMLTAPPPCDPLSRDEPAVMGTVYWAFGKACPWYVDNDPQLRGRVAIETTGRTLGRALLQLRAEPS